MTRRRMVLAICLAGLGGGLVGRWDASAPASQATQQDSLELRYAQARLRLAELRLQMAEDMNRRVRGTISDGLITQLSDGVEYFKQRVGAARGATLLDTFENWVQREELALRLADENAKKTTAASRAGVATKIDVDRAEASAEVAKLRLDLVRSLASAPAETRLKWQLEMLADDVAQLKEQTNLLGQNRLSQFY